MIAPLRRLAKELRMWPRRLAYAGRDRYCPVCNHSFRKFSAAGEPRRMDASCINCGALERHRLLWLFLRRHRDLIPPGGIRLLHVAPEPCITDKLRAMVGAGYLSADLHNPAAMEKMDICAIGYPDESFDAIYCNHVLEHVEDDRKALREFHRVLRPGGWAIIMVPTYPGPTYEDASIVTAEGRAEAFGQADHVRRYGQDVLARLSEAGFQASVSGPEALATGPERVMLGLTEAAGDIYFCSKPPARA